MKCNIFSVKKLATICLCLFAFVGQGFAAWDGSTRTQPTTTTIDDKTYYVIANEANLAWFANRVNSNSSYASINAILTANLDMGNKAFTPIGNGDRTYKGTFDGNGYTISNLNISSDNHYVGLFGYVDGGTIKNVKVENSTITRTGTGGMFSDPYYVGVVVGYLKSGTVTGVATENASVAGSDKNWQNWSSGGIAGYNGGTISMCSVEGGTIKGRTEVGGIAGTNTGTITDCLASPDVLSGSILLVTGIGGIAGKNDGTISRVVYTGDRVSNTQDNSRVTGGPITGSGSNDCVEMCYYTENVGLAPTGGDAHESDIDKIKEELGYPWDVGDGSLIIVNSVYYYTVTIHPNGHGSQQTLSVKKNQKIESLDSIMVGGFKRIGLCKDAGCTQNWDFSNNRVTSDITLYAKWAQAYTVTFTIGTLADGETGSFPSGAITMKYCVPGEKITADGITSPTFASGVLAGWSRADDGTVDADLGTMGSEAITVYAIENISNVVNITYKPGSNGTGSELTQKAVPGATVNLKGNLFTRTNYAQDGWSRSNDGNKAYELNQSITVPADGLTLYPHWKQTTVKIEYKYSESSASDPSGKTIAAAYKSEDADFNLTNETFTREGYRQDGWSLVYGGNKSYDLGAPYNVNQATTFYPHWIQIFTVTFNANNHGTAPDALNVDAGSKIQEPEVPLAEGYTFNGWNTKDDGTGVTWDFNTNTVTANTTLYAMWNADKFTVTYRYTIDGGTNYTIAGDVDSVTAGTANVAVRNNYMKDGYNMTAWATEDVTVSGGAFTMPTKDVVFTSTGTVAEYTITYHLDNGTNAGANPSTYTILTDDINLAAATREGYTFEGWYSESGFSNKVTTIAKGSFGNKDLFAKWTAIPVVVTIVGSSSSVTYNGSEQSVEGYEVTSITCGGVACGDAFTAANVALKTGVSASAAGTNVGSYSMGLSGASFETKNTAYTAVTFNVTDGALTIGKKAVTFTGTSATETYTGSLITNTEFTVEGLVSGHTHNVEAKAEGTEVSATAYAGTITDAASVVIKDASDNDVTANYEITTTAGSLTIEKAAGLTVALDGATFTYDAAAHALSTAATTNAVTGTTAIEYQFGGDAEWTATLASLTKVAAGTYTVNVRATNPNYSNTATGSATLTIDKAAITVNVTGSSSSVKYDGEEHSVSGYTATSESGLFNVGKVQFSGTASAVRTIVGKTDMGLKVADFSYNDVNIAATFNVTDGYQEILAADEVVVTITGHNVTKTYDGTEASATGYEISASSTTFDKSTVSYSGTASAKRTDAGTTAMNLDKTKFSSTDENFSTVTFVIAEDGYVTINKKTAEIVWGSAEFTYTGLAQVPTATVSNLEPGDECTVTVTGAGTDAGNYTATATELNNANYVLPESGLTKAFAIGQATIVVETESATRAYNGEALTAGGSIKSGLVNGETATITLTGTQTNVGKSSNTFSMNWGTAKLANYKISSTLGELEVTAAAITVDEIAGATYNGTKQNPIVTVKDANDGSKALELNTDYTVSWDNDGFTNAGDYKVTVTGKGNYTGSETKTYTIAKAKVSVKADDKSQMYGDEAVALTATVTGKPESGTAVNYTLARETGDNVGTYAISVNLGENLNYDITTTKGTYTITKASFTVAGASYDGVYDGANHGDAAVVKYGETVVTDATVEYSTDNGTTWSATVPTIKDVGSKTVKVRANKTNFAQAEDDYTLAVTAREVSLSWTPASFVYDGNSHIPTATAGNVVDGETVTVTVDASGAKTDVGDDYVAEATGLSSTNYKLPATVTTTFSISKRAVAFTGKTDTKTFTGSEIELTEVTAEGLVDGHTHNVTYSAKGTAADEYIGTITAVADVKIMNGTTDVTANYDITTTAGKLTIAAAEKFTIALESDEGYTYDGAAHHNTKTATSDAAIGTITFQYQFDGDGETWVSDLTSLAKTDAGSYTINVKATNPNYSEAATTTAKLTIAKRAITLTSASDSKFYDGTALTANTVTVTEGSYANDESFQYNVTGSQIEVGASENTFTYSATSSAKVENYEVTLVKGKLTVDPVVTFVMNGHGTQVDKQNVLTGEKATEPTEPSAEGYTFGGWFTDDGTFANAYNFDAAINANTTLYAKWTINKYTVTFVDEDGETVLASKDYDYGTAVADIETPETPTKAEDNTYTYAFAGWSPELAAVTGVATYKATYTPTYKNYHIAFKTDANVVLFDKEDYHYGDALVAPANPTREATDEYTYEFDKWEPAVPATVEGSKTYVAKFTPIPNKYTLTWDTDGGTITSAADAYTVAGQVAYGTELFAPAVTKKGFTFAGWTPEVSTMPANNITFKALWTEQLVVSFNVQGHGTAPASQLLDPNEKAVEPTAPTAQNYSFGGWFKDAACTQPWNFDDVVTASMELFAKWTGAFSLTFTLDGVDIETRSAVSEGTVITVLDSATKDGHDFAGWVMETEGVTFEAVTGGHKFVMPAKAVNISGAYKYFVKYKLDGAQVGDPETYTYGTEVTVREPETKTGYDISDWTSSVTITDGKFAMPAADVELTATSTIQKFTVTYKVTGSYFANDAFDVTENVAYGTKLSLITTDMTKEGYTFRNWELVEGDIPIYIHSGDKYIIMGVKDVVFEGSYTLNHHTVTWKNGEEIFSSSSADYNTKVSAPTAPTKNGYEFAGWTTSDVTLADDYSFTMPDNAVTLNADWDLVTYEIAYETNGGEAVSSSSYTIESADVTLPTPTRTGYEFRGWFDNEGLSGTAVTKVAAGSFGNKTFYAKWSDVTYNITYSGLGDMTHENPAMYTVEDAIVLANPSDSTGYSFDGWYIDEDEVTGIAKGSTGEKTIVAKWSPKNVNFKIVYKLYSPTGVVEKTMVERTYLVPADADINRYILWENFGAGYSYDLVYINGVERNKSHITEKIARDGSTVVEVRVEHNEFTFTFYTEGESGWEQWNAQPRFYGYDVETVNVAAPTAPTKTGYTLVGWCADAETCESVQTFPMNVPAKNMNFYPKWTINQYTITFDTKGGSAIDAITQDYNTAVTAPEDPTRAGYLFAGWDKTIPATMPAESITISANWDMDVKATGYTGAYDGNAHGITVTAPEGATVTFSDTENGTYVATLTYTDVGTYTVYYKASQEGYADVKGSATVTITPATMTLVVAGYTGTYDGVAHSGTATPSVIEGTSVSYSIDNGTTWTTDVPTFTNAGTVDVKVKAVNSNYQTVEDSYTVAIEKKVIEVAVSGNNASATYDGTDHLVEGFDATTEDKLYDVANVALVDGKLATATTKIVGKAVMGLTAESFVNNDNNFTVTFTVTDGYSEVTPKAAKITITAAEKTYGDADPTFTGKVEGLVKATDLGDIAYVRSGDDERAGVHQDELSATYTENGNYDVTVVPANFTINKRAVSFTGETATKDFTGSEIELAKVTIGGDGLVSGHTHNVTYSAKGADVGDYDGEITAATAVVIKDASEKDVTKNYAITTTAGKLTIQAAGTFTITLANDTTTYDGAEHYSTKIASSEAVSGETTFQYQFVGDGETWVSDLTSLKKMAAGEYTINVKASNPNYAETATATAKLIINKKSATITVASAEKTYGDADPTFTGSVEGLVAAADLGTITYSRTVSDEVVGSYAGVIVANFTANDNYEVAVVKGNFTISPVINVVLPEDVELVCTAGATGAENCTEDGKSINHTYGEETSPLPGAVMKDSTGAVDATWHFEGWFENEDGIEPEVTKIDATEKGPVTIYPFFTKELDVEIVDTTITVVIDNNDSKDSVDNKVTDAIRDAGIEDPTKPADSKYSYEFEKYEYDVETGKVTPVFKPTGREYKIVYVMPKAAQLSKEIKTYTYGVGTVLPTASIKGDKDWMFMGWYADEGFIGERTKEITKKDIGKKVLYPMFQKVLRYSTRDESGVISVLYDIDEASVIEKSLEGVHPADYDESGVTYTFSKWVEKNGVYTAEYTEKTGINHRAIANFHVMVSGRTLEISGAKMGAKIAVFDMSGRMVAQGIVENGTTRVDLAKAGSYVVRVNNQVNRVNVR